ncbi:Transcriptional regulatory protein moc3 [Fusarium austroafricanum]|uniref:Transcriptional regulatory protein moc3 n=1 Tax=Fusarium austroafricanum TaxID=2364996 RepID=A0A8H4P3C2_9HYPO|nr:Transcriptional regulatory protein moc3 [Fusarium austroafricanum]
MYSIPPQSPSKPSGRKGSKKVRTGCITCKIRKVKCDEAKPYCLRCIKTGRQCDGYRPSPNSSPEPGGLSPSPGFENPQEARAFDHYRVRTAKVLSGPIDASFWGGVVLKMSTTEPAVRHAILAISSLHEAVDSRGKSARDIDTRFAFREYGNAITSLRNWGQRSEPSVVPLLVCVLFICVEFLIDRDSAAQMHICQGRNILSTLGDGRSPSMEMIKHTLVPIYARLSLSSFLFGSRPPPIPAHLRSWTEMPAVFASIEEARFALYLLQDDVLQFSTKARNPVYDPSAEPRELDEFQIEQQRLISQLNRWNAAFTVITSMSSQSPSLESSLNILRIYHQSTFIWISTALEIGETKFDNYTSNFANIITLASTIIGSVPSNARLEPFSFETELIPPVFWAATRCRHPLLRRAALKLLTRDQMRNRRENLWHARETSVIAARCIEIEESDFDFSDLDLDLIMDPQMESDSNVLSGGSPEADYDILTCNPKKIKVDVSQYPGLPAPTPSFTDPTPEEVLAGSPGSLASSLSSPTPASEPMSPIQAALDGIQHFDVSALKSANLESPFGIPESRRIKNTIIGPSEEGGISVTFFKDPDPGETKWKVTREWLRC